MKKTLQLLSLIIFLTSCKSDDNKTERHPNIIIILADDLGYGDISCMNENSKIHTPHIDKLANEGLAFTDAHTNSSVCTPTRYGILTGRYAWRSQLKHGVTWSYDTAIIEPSRTTLPKLLKKQHYKTACIGKWHLGLNWTKDETGQIDFFAPINGGPKDLGFDYFYGITASLDIPPYFYIQNDKITATSIDTIEANYGKGFWREGPIGNDFKHEEVLPKLTQEAVSFINRQTNEKPFFLYFPLPAPHTPILPIKEFKGKSETNEYGDFVLMVDDVVAQISKSLEENGMADNTILIFTSDNGCSPMADFKELTEMGHSPGYHFRGHKADIFDAGHRVPFIVRWPQKLKASSITNELFCTTDLFATTAAIIGEDLAENEGEDSYNLSSVFYGEKQDFPIRETIVHHSVDGYFSIRKGEWKLNFCAGSGGWSYPTESKANEQGLPQMQLYNMKDDVGETQNLIEDYPEIVDSLTKIMQKYIDDGRSTIGLPQHNSGEIFLYKTAQ